MPTIFVYAKRREKQQQQYTYLGLSNTNRQLALSFIILPHLGVLQFLSGAGGGNKSKPQELFSFALSVLKGVNILFFG